MVTLRSSVGRAQQLNIDKNKSTPEETLDVEPP